MKIVSVFVTSARRFLARGFHVPRSRCRCPKNMFLPVRMAATSMSIQMENPQRGGSKAWEGFEKYKHATTIAEAIGNSANRRDVR